jgi:hypothetical protein
MPAPETPIVGGDETNRTIERLVDEHDDEEGRDDTHIEIGEGEPVDDPDDQITAATAAEDEAIRGGAEPEIGPILGPRTPGGRLFARGIVHTLDALSVFNKEFLKLQLAMQSTRIDLIAEVLNFKISLWDALYDLERDGQCKGAAAAQQKMLALFWKYRSSNIAIGLANWFNPNGCNPYSERAQMRGYPPHGWMQGDVVRQVEDALRPRSEFLQRQARQAAATPVEDMFRDEEMRKRAIEAGFDLDGDRLRVPTLWEQYQSFKDYELLSARAGRDGQKTVLERLQIGPNVAEYWRNK